MYFSTPTVDATPELSTDQVLTALAVLEQPSAADAETREKISRQFFTIEVSAKLASIQNTRRTSRIRRV